MSEAVSVALLAALVLLCACAVVITVVLSVTAQDVRRTLRRVDALLGSCEQALRDIHRVVAASRHVFEQACRMTAQVGQMVEQVSDMAAGLFEPLRALRERAQAFFGHRGENGTRSGPRRHARGT